MNSATISVKDLKSVLTQAKKFIGKNKYAHMQAVHVSCNGSAVIRYANFDFVTQRSIPCTHEGADFAYQYDFADISGMVAKTAAKTIDLDDMGGITVGVVNRVFEAPSHTERLGVDEKGVSALTDVCRFIPAPLTLDNAVNVDAGQFRAACNALLHAVDTESSRYALSGIAVEISAANVRLVATDARRLAFRDVEIIGRRAVPVEGVKIIPAQAIKSFVAMLPKKLLGEIVTISTNDDSATLEHAGDKIQSKLVQGRFPDYRQVMPKGTRPVAIPREKLISLVKELIPHTDEENRGIDIKHSPGLMTLVLKSKAIVLQFELPSDPVHVKTTLDARYLCDALEACSAECVTWGTTDGVSAMEFYDFEHTEIVMPLTRDR